MVVAVLWELLLVVSNIRSKSLNIHWCGTGLFVQLGEHLESRWTLVQRSRFKNLQWACCLISTSSYNVAVVESAFSREIATHYAVWMVSGTCCTLSTRRFDTIPTTNRHTQSRNSSNPILVRFIWFTSSWRECWIAKCSTCIWAILGSNRG